MNIDLQEQDFNPECNGKEITKEEFEKQISGSLVYREPCELTLIKDTDYALSTWLIIFKAFKDSGIPMRNDLSEKANFWKKRQFKYVAMINGTESKDLHCIALVSRKSHKNPFFVNLIITMAPVMTQPFVEMMVNTLKLIAIEYNSTLIVPRQYQNIVDNVYETELTTAPNDVKTI